MNYQTIIIGSGLAGITLARELRKIDKEQRILVITADDGSFYSKPNLSNAFAAGKQAADLILTPASKLENDLNIKILSHTVVTRINADLREVDCPQGRFGYGQLVLAVGASQMALSLAGNASQDVLSVNSLTDYAELRRQMEGKRRVAIIGAGLIGCEFANDMCLGGYEVALFDLADQPLSRLLPPQAAQRLRDKLEAIGVTFHLSTQLATMQHAADAYVLVDQHGCARPYDLVLSAIGLRPNLTLAKTADVATNLGILTDRYLRTSDPFIYALGDCVETGGRFLPYVMPIMHGAKKLARTLTGAPDPLDFPVMPVLVKTPSCPTVISSPCQLAGVWDEVLNEDGVRALYIDQQSGSPTGFVLQGSFTKERMALVATMPNMRVDYPT